MSKFIVVVFIMMQNHQMQFVEDFEVRTLNECAELVTAINNDKSSPNNAACLIVTQGPKI